MADPYDLQRFLAAQAGTLPQALAELRAGRKRSHWMWFVFPQLAGLGSSAMAVRYALSGLAEARAYLAHPVLGQQLREAVAALLSASGDDPVAIMGSIDATKLRSSMTLFAAAGEAPGPQLVLDRFFGGAGDPRTRDLLGPGRTLADESGRA